MPEYKATSRPVAASLEPSGRPVQIQGDGFPSVAEMFGFHFEVVGQETQRVVVMNMTQDRPFVVQTPLPTGAGFFRRLAGRIFNPVVIFTARETAVRIFHPVQTVDVALGAIPSNLSTRGQEAVARIEALAVRREEVRASIAQAVESQEAAVFGGGTNIGAQAATRGSGPLGLIVNAVSVPFVTAVALRRIEEEREQESALTASILNNVAIVRDEKAIAFRDLGLQVSDLGEPVLTAAMPGAGEADVPGGVLLAGPKDPTFIRTDN